MSKKKVDLNSSPLESVTIGQVKQNKFGGIKLLLLFLLFFGLIYFLPDISKSLTKYYDMYIKGVSPVADSDTQTKNTANTGVEKKETQESISSEKNVISDNTLINFQNLKFSNFSYSAGTLSFSAINTTDKDITLKNTFIELYDEANNLINRILLVGTIMTNGSKNFSYQIQGNISYFYLKYISESDYTYYNFTPNESGDIVLVCTKANDIITYRFNDTILYSINEKMNYLKSMPDYATVYNEYNTFAIKNSSKSGIKVSSNVINEEYQFDLTIDYTLLTGVMEKYEYYSKNVEPRIVKFELESLFYKCN